MDRIADFLAMGGYAVYVWPAFGIAAVLMGGLAVVTLAQHRAARRELERLQQQRGDRT